MVQKRSIFDEVAVNSAHTRVRALWGKASLYPCIECGGQARDWAYDGTDPTELYGGAAKPGSVKMRYSRFPEFYMPMCRKCHGMRDGQAAAGELEIFRRIMHTLRLSAEEVAEKMGVPIDPEALSSASRGKS